MLSWYFPDILLIFFWYSPDILSIFSRYPPNRIGRGIRTCATSRCWRRRMLTRVWDWSQFAFWREVTAARAVRGSAGNNFTRLQYECSAASIANMNAYWHALQIWTHWGMYCKYECTSAYIADCLAYWDASMCRCSIPLQTKGWSPGQCALVTLTAMIATMQ